MEKSNLIEKINLARIQSRNGEVISEEELDAEVETWFKE